MHDLSSYGEVQPLLLEVGPSLLQDGDHWGPVRPEWVQVAFLTCSDHQLVARICQDEYRLNLIELDLDHFDIISIC